jgi:flagellar FliL protein
MAKAVAETAGAPAPAAKKPSIVLSIVGFVLVTLLAAGSGVGIAWQLQSMKSNAATKAVDSHGGTEAAAGAGSKSPIAEGTIIKPLPSILTNLADQNTKKPGVRVDISLLLPKGLPQEDEMVALLAQDIVAFLRTVTTTQIEGPTGFQMLREDLEDIARIRSQGKARGLVIRSFMIE